MPNKSGKPPDQKRIVAALASQCHMPIAEMTTLYERERAQLAIGARITKFLDIFATRRILEAFRMRARTTPATPLEPAAMPDRSGE
jgi:predicted component of type VI protein secretion system